MRCANSGWNGVSRATLNLLVRRAVHGNPVCSACPAGGCVSHLSEACPLRRYVEVTGLNAQSGVEPPHSKSGFGEDAAVVGFVLGNDVVGAVVTLGVDAGELAHFAATVGARENVDG